MGIQKPARETASPTYTFENPHADGTGALVRVAWHTLPPDEWIAELHRLDRTHYDTPSSIAHCACDDCNKARVGHGHRPRRWRCCETRRTVVPENSGDPCYDEIERHWRAV